MLLVAIQTIIFMIYLDTYILKISNFQDIIKFAQNLYIKYKDFVQINFI